MRKRSLWTPLFTAGTLFIPTIAWAQGAEEETAVAPADAAAAEAPAAGAAAPVETAQMEETTPELTPPAPPPEDPMQTEASTEMSAAEGMAAPTAEGPPVEPPAEEEAGGVPGWFRLDSDGLGLQLWAGASHDVGGISIASDIYVDSHTFAEFDIGVELPIGDNVLLIPMAGIGFDWSQMKPVSLIAPQLFAYFDFDPIYIEWWSQFFLNSIFADPGYTDAGDGTFVEVSETVGDSWYNRLFVLFNATENFSIGPQIEPTIALNDAAKAGDSALASLPIGGRVNLGYGENNTLGLFLGYETVEEARGVYTELDEMGGEIDSHERGIVGRFTFVRTW